MPQTSGAFYQVRREKRLPSARQIERGARTSYLGSETFIALVDASDAPYPDDLHQLAVSVLCTNRDLPLTMPVGRPGTDFHRGRGSAGAERALHWRPEPAFAVLR